MAISELCNVSIQWLAKGDDNDKLIHNGTNEITAKMVFKTWKLIEEMLENENLSANQTEIRNLVQTICEQASNTIISTKETKDMTKIIEELINNAKPFIRINLKEN